MKFFLFLVLVFNFVPAVYAKSDAEYVQGWYERASADLSVAHLLFEKESDAATICFHSHQAIEKYLKGLSYKLGRTPKKANYTNELGRSLRKLVPGIEDFERSFRQLDEWYFNSRYPSKKRRKMFTREDATECVEAADNLTTFVLNLPDIEEKFNEL